MHLQQSILPFVFTDFFNLVFYTVFFLHCNNTLFVNYAKTCLYASKLRFAFTKALMRTSNSSQNLLHNQSDFELHNCRDKTSHFFFVIFSQKTKLETCFFVCIVVRNDLSRVSLLSLYGSLVFTQNNCASFIIAIAPSVWELSI